MMKKCGILKKKISTIVALSLLFSGLTLAQPKSAHSMIVGATVPGAQWLFPIGVTVIISGAAGFFGGGIIWATGAGCRQCMGPGARWIEGTGQALFGIGLIVAVAGAILEHQVNIPPLVRLPESSDFEKASGLSFSEIAEFNDSLAQVAAVDEDVMKRFAAYSQRVNREASMKDASIDPQSWPETKSFFASLGIKDEAELNEIPQNGISEALVAKFAQSSGLSEPVAHVYLKARLGL